MGHDQRPRGLTSSSFTLLSNVEIFSALASFGVSADSVLASVSVEYVLLAAKTLDAVDALGRACLDTALRRGCRADNERDMLIGGVAR